MRYNPPPNWPAPPPGWNPPPGWQPDPSWPPLPPGWPLWLAAGKSRRTAVIVGASVAAVVIALITTVILVSTGSTPSREGRNPGAAADTHTPPVVVLDGKDLNLGSGVTTATSVCKDNPSPGVEKSVGWLGVSNAPYFAEVSLGVLKHDGTETTLLTVDLPDGDHYNADLKTTHVTVDGPTNGVYSFSGTVHKDHDPASTSENFLQTLDVHGSITCANDGSHDGCKYATAAEMSTASGLALDGMEDRGLEGCLYTSSSGHEQSYVKLEYFPTTGWNEHVNHQAVGENESIEDIPGIGAEAKYVSPVVFVKLDSQYSFDVLVSDQGQDAETAVAKLVAPRVQAG